MPKLLKPNLDKIGITILLFLLTSFFFVLFTHPETVRPIWLLTLIPLYIVSGLLYQSLAKQTFLLRVVRWIVFAPLTLLVILCVVSQIVPAKPPKDFIITHNFVDLSQIFNISKYRSCSGHQTVDQYSDEPVSNMQHYIPTVPSIDPDKVKIYAPFDGYLAHIFSEGISMVPASSKIPWWPFQWRFNMPHTHSLPEYDGMATFVKAGTLIGYVNALDRYGQRLKGTQFRVGVQSVPPEFKNGNGEPFKYLDSAFHFMSDEVFAQYQAAIPGLKSREDMIIPRSWREAHPCKFQGKGPNFDIIRGENLPVEEYAVFIGVDIKDKDKMNKRWMCDSPEDIANNRECSKP